MEHLKAKIQEAENWLNCDCEMCRFFRQHMGRERIEDYLSQLKGMAEWPCRYCEHLADNRGYLGMTCSLEEQPFTPGCSFVLSHLYGRA